MLLDLQRVDGLDGRAILVQLRHHTADLPVAQQLDAPRRWECRPPGARHPHPLSVVAIDDPEAQLRRIAGAVGGVDRHHLLDLRQGGVEPMKSTTGLVASDT